MVGKPEGGTHVIEMLEVASVKALPEEAISELRAEVALAIEMLDTIPTDPKLFARRAGTCIPLVRGGLAMVLAKTSTVDGERDTIRTENEKLRRVRPAQPSAPEAVTTPSGHVVKQGACLCIITTGCAEHDSGATPPAAEPSLDVHGRLQDIVDASFGFIPTTPIEGLLAILEKRLDLLLTLSTTVRQYIDADDLDRIAEFDAMLAALEATESGDQATTAAEPTCGASYGGSAPCSLQPAHTGSHYASTTGETFTTWRPTAAAPAVHGINVHPSSLPNVVDVLEDERASLRAENAKLRTVAEMARAVCDDSQGVDALCEGVLRKRMNALRKALKELDEGGPSR